MTEPLLFGKEATDPTVQPHGLSHSAHKENTRIFQSVGNTLRTDTSIEHAKEKVDVPVIVLQEPDRMIFPPRPSIEKRHSVPATFVVTPRSQVPAGRHAPSHTLKSFVPLRKTTSTRNRHTVYRHAPALSGKVRPKRTRKETFRQEGFQNRRNGIRPLRKTGARPRTTIRETSSERFSYFIVQWRATRPRDRANNAESAANPPVYARTSAYRPDWSKAKPASRK